MEPSGAGLTQDFRVFLDNLPQVTHFELIIDGTLIDSRKPVNDYVRTVEILFQDPSQFEVRFYLSETATSPFATASCAGEPGDDFGRLIIYDSWSVEPYDATVSDFWVYATIPGITHFEVHVIGDNGGIIGGRVPINSRLRSIHLMFADPSLLEVKFYDSIYAQEAVANGRLQGYTGINLAACYCV